MVDTGDRLSFSINGNDFNITDNLSGKNIVYSKGNFISFTLDKLIVLQHIKDILEALTCYKKKISFSGKLKEISTGKSILIREDRHFVWTLGLDGKGAVLDKGTFTHSIGFDITTVLRKINFVYSQVLACDAVLNPKRDIVRRITDVGLLVWVYNKHSVVVYEKNVQGCCMTNCLIDGVYYEAVLVGSSKENNEVTLFESTDLSEILSFPLDTSVLAYYPDVTESFAHLTDKQEEN